MYTLVCLYDSGYRNWRRFNVRVKKKKVKKKKEIKPEAPVEEKPVEVFNPICDLCNNPVLSTDCRRGDKEAFLERCRRNRGL